jgi:hypothetical protein
MAGGTFSGIKFIPGLKNGGDNTAHILSLTGYPLAEYSAEPLSVV